jgi:hypothetical protein
MDFSQVLKIPLAIKFEIQSLIKIIEGLQLYAMIKVNLETTCLLMGKKSNHFIKLT